MRDPWTMDEVRDWTRDRIARRLDNDLKRLEAAWQEYVDRYRPDQLTIYDVEDE